MNNSLPIISLELNSGVFRIKTQEAIYEISVNPDSSLTRVVEKVVEREVRPAVDSSPAPVQAVPTVQGGDVFYRDITEEMYKEIGKLARQLSLSIKEIPGSHFKGVDIEQTGIELEDAKGQLEDIVQMTEKATMDIMDLAETIQEDLQNVQGGLGSLVQLDFMAREDDSDLDWGDELDIPEETEAVENGLEGAEAVETFTAFIASMLEKQNSLKSRVEELPLSQGAAPPASAPPAKPQVKTVKAYKFDLDTIFQTMYEFCTNETVKDHIKGMRAEQATAFDQEAVLGGIGKLAANLTPDEDNFLDMPLIGILKGLYGATENDKFKNILKKMNQTAKSIFLEPNLPIEANMEEKEIMVEPESPEPEETLLAEPGITSEQLDPILAIINENIGDLEAEKERVASLSIREKDDATGADTSFTQVKREDYNKIVETINNSTDAVNRIMSSITRILEALAFQDLSGQRIMKIVRLISDVQVQLLSLLVSFGAKMNRKLHVPEGAAGPQDTDKLVQDEVDKMLERVSTPETILGGPDAEGRLDQDAVNNLLAEMGF